MLFFALIFHSTAKWPWIVALSCYGLITAIVVISRMISPTVLKESSNSPTALWALHGLYGMFSIGPALFCCYYLFCGWNSSGWWFYLFILLGLIISFVPGGCSFLTLILQAMGAFTVVPVWLWIIIIGIDALNVLSFILARSAGRR